jgi:YgiT-type zinc finger domain-containing protein
MAAHLTDLPFKTGDTSIVVVRGVPVTECGNCHEFLIAFEDMKRVEEILRGRRPGAELEVTRFAA